MPDEQQTVEQLQEYSNWQGVTVRVDTNAGVLAGVKLIGLASRNGRQYQEAALQRSINLYEGAKVNINHPKQGPLAPRDYQDRLGTIRDVEFRPGEGLFANLHFNPKHALAEQLLWDAQHNPRNVGFSHNVEARVARTEAGMIVEEITRVRSVDLVADPAATDGLFEQLSADRTEPQPAAAWDALTLDTLRLHRPDLLREIEEGVAGQSPDLSEELQSRLATLELQQVTLRNLLQAMGVPKSRDQLAVLESRVIVTPQEYARALRAAC
jgi:hypothetical protein